MIAILAGWGPIFIAGLLYNTYHEDQISGFALAWGFSILPVSMLTALGIVICKVVIAFRKS